HGRLCDRIVGAEQRQARRGVLVPKASGEVGGGLDIRKRRRRRDDAPSRDDVGERVAVGVASEALRSDEGGQRLRGPRVGLNARPGERKSSGGKKGGGEKKAAVHVPRILRP